MISNNLLKLIFYIQVGDSDSGKRFHHKHIGIIFFTERQKVKKKMKFPYGLSMGSSINDDSRYFDIFTPPRFYLNLIELS